MDKIGSAIIGILVFIALLVVFVPVISEQVAVGDDQRSCTDPLYPNRCLDLDDGHINWCSNETGIKCYAPTPIYNTSEGLCTNASGVHIVNDTAISTCDSIGWADGIIPYEDVGLNPTEVGLLGLIILFLIIGGVFGLVKQIGLQ